MAVAGTPTVIDFILFLRYTLDMLSNFICHVAATMPKHNDNGKIYKLPPSPDISYYLFSSLATEQLVYIEAEYKDACTCFSH